MKLGVCYNVFDCEELLESSIKSVRNQVDHICVVYQTTSNFGEKSNPYLIKLLNHLKSKKLIDSLIDYQPKIFTKKEKYNLCAETSHELQNDTDKRHVPDQFCNELTKREIGRKDCLKHGMTHFLSMDCDEFYKESELTYAKKFIFDNKIESSVCRMRIYGKYPTIEYLMDNQNAVPFIHACREDKPFKLATEYPMVDYSISPPHPIALDPTRKLSNFRINTYHFFSRDKIEMHHMTFVRKNIEKKLRNTSNKNDYGQVTDFLKQWNEIKPDTLKVLHPHQHARKIFTNAVLVNNIFNVDIENQCKVCCKIEDIKRCSGCKNRLYCDEECQTYDWEKEHQNEC